MNIGISKSVILGWCLKWIEIQARGVLLLRRPAAWGAASLTRACRWRRAGTFKTNENSKRYLSNLFYKKREKISREIDVRDFISKLTQWNAKQTEEWHFQTSTASRRICTAKRIHIRWKMTAICNEFAEWSYNIKQRMFFSHAGANETQFYRGRQNHW